MNAKILNVDDKEINRYIRTQILSGAGYVVVEAKGGREALDLCAAEQPELVLLDINMPDMSGLEVCERIKTECTTAQPVIVIHVSATATHTDDFVRGLEGGADAYLSEPVAPQLLLATVRSMLRLHRAEQELRERDAASRRLVESNVVGIGIAGEEDVRDANDEYLRIVGASREDLRAGRVNWRKATPAEHADRDTQAIAELLDRGSCAAYEKEFARPDGSRVPVLLGGALLRSAPFEAIAFVIDLTEQKRTEKQLKDRTEELARSNEELQRFAYLISHDLQSPLRTVASMAQLLIRRQQPALDDKECEIVDFIQSGVQRMSRLIKDLLDYSRVSETSQQQFVATDAGALAQWAVANLQSHIQESDASVVIEGQLPQVMADDQLARVFQNLIGNAIKYRATDRRPEIHVSAKQVGDECIFAVRDNGIGFEMVYADKVFGVFQRLHNSSQYEGTGIGLAICKKIIERYGGRIWVQSAPGEGSTFFFTVPITSAAASGFQGCGALV
jgi:PAS domain S-box-containing protein